MWSDFTFSVAVRRTLRGALSTLVSLSTWAYRHSGKQQSTTGWRLGRASHSSRAEGGEAARLNPFPRHGVEKSSRDGEGGLGAGQEPALGHHPSAAARDRIHRPSGRKRLEDGRLHPVFAGVYAVGRPHLTRTGYLMAAVLACGPGAALSHFSAAELYRIVKRHPGPVHVSVPYARAPNTPGIE